MQALAPDSHPPCDIFDNIHHVSFDAFTRHLSRVYEIAVRSGFAAHNAVFLVPKRQSAPTTSTWWTMMLLSELSDSFRPRPAYVFCTADDALRSHTAHTRTYAYVDDAMHSGAQAMALVAFWHECMRLRGDHDARIHIIVPFATNRSVTLLKERFGDACVVHVSSIVRTLGDIDPDLPPETHHLTTTYFDHTFPDDVSCAQSISAYVTNARGEGRACIVPPYKNVLAPPDVPATPIRVSFDAVDCARAYWVLPDHDQSLRTARVPEDTPWSRILIAGFHDTLAARLEDNVQFVFLGPEEACMRIFSRRSRHSEYALL